MLQPTAQRTAYVMTAVAMVLDAHERTPTPHPHQQLTNTPNTALDLPEKTRGASG